MTVSPLRLPGLPSRYQLRNTIARGEASEVLEAIDHERGPMLVAIKFLKTHGPHADVARVMFRREVAALKGLSHSAIVKILDTFEVDERLCGIVLELVAGGATLATLLEEVRLGRRSKPELAWRMRMALSLLDATAEVHRRHVIHRDLKPGNVLWDRDEDQLKLADFGTAAVLSLTARDPSGPTLRAFYTRPYAAPEQLLQRAPTFASDVYGLSLLITSLLAVEAPHEDFEWAHVEAFLEGFEEEARCAGASEELLVSLRQTLTRGMAFYVGERPSLAVIRDVLDRLQRAMVVAPVASLVLTNKAQDKVSGLMPKTRSEIEADLNTDLRVSVEDGDRGTVLKLFGHSTYAVVPLDGGQAPSRELRVIDLGQNPGPMQERSRKHASPCPVKVRFGYGSGQALVDFVEEERRNASVRASHALIERAEQIIKIERERLPMFVIDGWVDGDRVTGREEKVGRASGYEGASTERVQVTGGFLIEARVVTRALASKCKNVVREHLKMRAARSQHQGDAFEADDAAELEDAIDDPEWARLFDDLSGLEVLDDNLQLLGKVTGYDEESRMLHVQTDKTRTVLRRGTFVVRNFMEERLLRQQEAALRTYARHEAARPDLHALFSSAAAHTMRDKVVVELIQQRLTPEDRVRGIVSRILAADGVFCLQGPPGTGKTTIIAEVVAQELSRDPRSRVLVCSQANDAVVNAVERIRKVRESVGRDWITVRDAHADRARDEADWSGYDAAYTEFKDKVTSNARRELARVKRPKVVEEVVVEWLECVEKGTRHVQRDHKRLVQVWGATTSRAPRPLSELPDAAYDLVIIDEAAKATVAEVMVPLVAARRILLVGDQKQLPPFLEDTTVDALIELGISEADAKFSLFEHLMSLVPPAHRDMLDTQFRMHPSIGTVVSKLFYEGHVKNGANTATRPMPAGDFDRENRVMWVDVVGRDERAGATSRANEVEAEVIVRLLDKLDTDARAARQTLSVAVISPYKAQVMALKAKLGEFRSAWSALEVTAATVDAFQGREADVVLYSMVRVGSSERRFVADGRRFNVALSRAKSLLVMVGDRSGSRATELLDRLIGMIPTTNQVDAESFVPKAAWEAKQRARKAATPPRPSRPARGR